MSAATFLNESQRGPAEKLFELVLNASAHLWHNRPGYNVNNKWVAAKGRNRIRFKKKKIVPPGLFPPAAEALYRQLVDIFQLNSKLMAHFAGYALLETEWRDLKVACAALMLVQPISGQPVREDDGAVAFYDDDYRAIGEAMVLRYERKSKTMLTPKAVLRIATFLECPAIAEVNREAGFAPPSSTKPFLGRWRSAARQWLRVRELNLPMLEGLVRAGFKETIKKIARKAGYKPLSKRFFEVLGWPQRQHEDRRRQVGMDGLELRRGPSFEGLGEAEICAAIASKKLGFKDVVGRLPPEIGLSPAIMVTLLPSLSDRDLRRLTPTLESFGLLEDEAIRTRWEGAIESSTDQRAIHIARNVKSAALKEKLEEAADHAARKAVDQASGDIDLRVMFLVDKSGSMEAAIEQSKEALTRILAGFPPEKTAIASFDTLGTVLEPKAPSRAGIKHMLRNIRAGGGTMHFAAVKAIHESGRRYPKTATVIVIVAGDENGELGSTLARTFERLQVPVAAIALIDCSASAAWRGRTLRDCATALGVPFSELSLETFEDPYQVPRALRALLEAPVLKGTATTGWVEKVLAIPLLEKPEAL